MANDSQSQADDVSRRVCGRIRDLRSDAGWSLDVLSRASGVSRSMLSQIEREQANPTLAVTVKIATAFGLTLADLIDQPTEARNIEVIRSTDREHLFRSDDSCTIRTLSPLHLEKDVEFYEVTLQPGGSLRSAPHFEKTREFLTVTRGTVELTSGEESSALEQGDSAGYRADVQHSIHNTGDSESVIFLVVIYQS